MTILNNPAFVDAYDRLARVSLNPRRHTAPNAQQHSEAVAALATRLAVANDCSAGEVRLLEDLGRAHDIGKVTGTARPERSVSVLRDCGVADERLLRLVKWHDTSLPWWRASERGQPPSDKAWRRLARDVDIKLLAIFMVADRVDAPPGWRRNAPTRWFLDELRTRDLLGPVCLDDAAHPSEVSAGGVLVRRTGAHPQALVIRVRREGFELPKGGIEWDELPEEAAARETREEASVSSDLHVHDELGHLDYDVGSHRKRVRYFRMSAAETIAMGSAPPGTRERRWVAAEDLAALPLVNDDLRPLIRKALS